MWLYLIIFAIPVIAYLNGGAENRNKHFLACYLLALSLFVGFADMLGGYDRYIYGAVFDAIADGITHDDDFLLLRGMTHFEFGYSALSYIIALITENRYIYIFIITMIMYFFFYKAFEKYMTNYPLAMIIFLGMVFFFSFTYLRQVLAFSIAWWGVKFLIERKTWKFFAVALVVALLHKSGIVFACLYFVPRIKWRPIEILIILGVCAIVGLSGLSSSLYDAYVETTEDLYQISNYSIVGEARMAYALEVLFFVWLILSNYSKIESTRKNLIFLNIAWMFCAILLLFIRSENGGRMAWYFTIGIIYSITLIRTSNEFHKRFKNNLSTLIIVVMLALYIRVYVGWQQKLYLYPYKTFLTNGHRNSDMTMENYEYDFQYDQDKFYRPAFRFL